MKTLYLFRHAKAVGHSDQTPDVSRELSERGIRSCTIVARNLSNRGLVPQLILTSPSRRARQSGEILASELTVPTGIQTFDKIYDGSVQELLDIIYQLDDRFSSVMLVGHNPILSNFVSAMLDDEINHLPKSGLVCIEFDVPSWQDIEKGSGLLEFFIVPTKNKKSQVINRVQSRLESNMIETISSLFGDLDARVLEELQEPIAKSAEKLSRKIVKVIYDDRKNNPKKADQK
jgi:phosphohistidine phosphatase